MAFFPPICFYRKVYRHLHMEVEAILLKMYLHKICEHNYRVIPYQIDQKYQMLDGTITDFDETLHTCTSIWEIPKSKIFFRSDLQGPSYGGWKFWPRNQNAFIQMLVDWSILKISSIFQRILARNDNSYNLKKMIKLFFREMEKTRRIRLLRYSRPKIRGRKSA